MMEFRAGQTHLKPNIVKTLIKELVKRLTDEELEEIFSLVTRLLRKHLTDSEYHTLFLKDFYS